MIQLTPQMRVLVAIEPVAAEPERAGSEKYDVTAVAMIALLKYGTGVPFKRLERLEQQLGMPLPATTQWELVEAGAKRIRPVWDELIRQAAQGSVMHNDDIGMRILRLARDSADKRTGPLPVEWYRSLARGESRCTLRGGSMRARTSPRC